jgi:uncharacterized protein YigA (DUF484 family)
MSEAKTSVMTAAEVAALRAAILADPALVLDDGEVMAALIAAGDGGGRNVVDLRGALVSRLESRLDQLSKTHRSVIAAAYENLAGAAQVHRACLRLLDAQDLAAFLRALTIEIPQIVAVDGARLCIESETDPAPETAGLPDALAARLVALPEHGLAAYAALDETPERDGVWLRETPAEAELIWGDDAAAMRSEALIALDAGPRGRGRRAMIAFGAEDVRRFSPDQGVDLVAFLGGVAGRALWRLAPFA